LGVMAKKRMSLEDQLRKAIEESGLPLYKLGERAGVSDGLLSNFVRGHRTMTLKTADKLAQALGLELRQRRGK
jgi:transcriptional regulator with XRE-family HTH domain